MLVGDFDIEDAAKSGKQFLELLQQCCHSVITGLLDHQNQLQTLPSFSVYINAIIVD